MKKVIVIPVLNPDDKLKELVSKNLKLKNQVILVDDGSNEKYQQIFCDLSEKCIVLHHEINRGKGEAVKTALQYIKANIEHYDIIGVMDADGQHLLDDMEKILLKAYRSPGTLILGSRNIDKSMPWKSRLGNKITQQILWLVSGVFISDTQTGLRAFSSNLLNLMLEIPGSRYEYETNVILECAKQKIEIIEDPIHTIYHDKNNSCSHFRRLRDSFRIYKDILKFSISSFSGFN